MAGHTLRVCAHVHKRSHPTIVAIRRRSCAASRSHAVRMPLTCEACAALAPLTCNPCAAQVPLASRRSLPVHVTLARLANARDRRSRAAGASLTNNSRAAHMPLTCRSRSRSAPNTCRKRATHAPSGPHCGTHTHTCTHTNTYTCRNKPDLWRGPKPDTTGRDSFLGGLGVPLQVWKQTVYACLLLGGAGGGVGLGDAQPDPVPARPGPARFFFTRQTKLEMLGHGS